MKKEMDDDDYTEQWIALFERAAKLLIPERFTIWVYGVGLEGTYEERCKVGEAILETLVPSQQSLQVKIVVNTGAAIQERILYELSTAMREALP